MEEFQRRGVCSGSDQTADIRVARRNDSVKRGIDLFKRLHLFQPPDIGLGRFDCGTGGLRLGDVGIRILLGNRILLQESLVTGRIRLSQAGIGLRGDDIRACLHGAVDPLRES